MAGYVGTAGSLLCGKTSEGDPETVNAMFKASAEESVESARVLLRRGLGPEPADVDDASVDGALMERANDGGLESS